MIDKVKGLFEPLIILVLGAGGGFALVEFLNLVGRLVRYQPVEPAGFISRKFRDSLQRRDIHVLKRTKYRFYLMHGPWQGKIWQDSSTLDIRVSRFLAQRRG